MDSQAGSNIHSFGPLPPHITRLSGGVFPQPHSISQNRTDNTKTVQFHPPNTPSDSPCCPAILWNLSISISQCCINYGMDTWLGSPPHTMAWHPVGSGWTGLSEEGSGVWFRFTTLFRPVALCVSVGDCSRKPLNLLRVFWWHRHPKEDEYITRPPPPPSLANHTFWLRDDKIPSSPLMSRMTLITRPRSMGYISVFAEVVGSFNCDFLGSTPTSIYSLLRSLVNCWSNYFLFEG